MVSIRQCKGLFAPNNSGEKGSYKMCRNPHTGIFLNEKVPLITNTLVKILIN